jgi:chemotaxis protein methyltransferase CheR
MRRMRALGIKSFREYYRKVEEDGTGRELAILLDNVTTNKTEFFREPQQFAHYARYVLPVWRTGPPQPLRVWSAACSSGEEVWSLAMTSYEWLGTDIPLKVLGTDISSRVLHVAKKASYAQERMVGVPKELQNRYWEKQDDGRVGAGKALRMAAYFHRFNLLGEEEYPFHNKFDAVFCRNVMIYFDRPQQETVVNRISRVLKKGGYLYVGLSESLMALKHPFKSVGTSVYQLP